MNLQVLLEEIQEEIKPFFGKGVVANYIPALAKVPATRFGMAICTVDGETYKIGDAEEGFSIQSISKIFTLTMALKYVDDSLWERVGIEPSGNPFNSLVQLEYEEGIPRNPFINAGAHVVTDCIISNCDYPKQQIIDFVRNLADNPGVKYDMEVAASEAATGHRNAALAHFLKNYNRIENRVSEVLDVYFHQCSIRMSCTNLARACVYLARGGKNLRNEPVVTARQAKRINAIMLTCGLYDAVGDFAFWVGLPGKSGVGGGIVAIIPGKMAIATWSPALNHAGNSLVGTKALELFTTKTGMSIF